jgi:hypothetical protein
MEIKEHGEGCVCGACQGHGATCGMWGHHHWGHMIIKFFIVLFIFWAGVQFGELKATVDNFYSGGMGGWGGRNAVYMGVPAQGMMTNDFRTSSAVPVGAKMMQVSSTTGI